MTPTGPVPIHMVTIPITRDHVADGASVRMKTIEMSADDAQYLIRAGWTKLAEWTRDEAA